MSRIGKSPIEIPQGVSLVVTDTKVVSKGTKGELTLSIPYGIKVAVDGSIARIIKVSSDRKADALHGLVRALLANNITGVSKGWTKTLELSGVGYRAAVDGTTLVLTVGFSHQVKINPPSGITFSVVEGKIIVSGIDRQAVGQVAADVRSVKPPEPYKGKGIKYVGEYIRKKAGKAKAAGGSAGAK